MIRTFHRWGARLLAICALVQVGATEEPSARRTQQAVPASSTAAYPYLLSLPKDYESDPARRWPLLLFLHGAGHRGDDLWKLATLGPPKLIEPESRLSAAERAAAQELTTKFIVISPQCAADSVWDTKRLLRLLGQVEARWRVDAARVYATGASMGGRGTWMLAAAEPGRFAAIAPVCGGGVPGEVSRARGQRREALKSLGVWAFHNDGDPTVPLASSEAMIAAFRAVDATDVQLTVYPGNRHDSWTKAYATLELYEWLLRHERSLNGK